MDHALALADRGSYHLECGELEEAMADLRASQAKFEEMPHANLITLVKIIQAKGLRQQGRLVEAQHMLDEVQATVIGTKWVELIGFYYQTRGDVYTDLARWSEAFELYNKAFTINASIHNYKEMALTLKRLASISAKQGQWETASEYTSDAGQIWNALAAKNKYSPSHASQKADEADAQGIYLFSMKEGDRSSNLTKARELFWSAVEAVPDNVWYQLNLAYTYAALKQWQEASQVVEGILEVQTQWVHSIAFELLAFYGLQEIGRLLDTGQYVEAKSTCRCHTIPVGEHKPVN